MPQIFESRMIFFSFIIPMYLMYFLYCQLPRTAGTKCHQLGGFGQQKPMLPPSRRLGVQNQGVGMAGSFGGWREAALPLLGVALMFGVLGL